MVMHLLPRGGIFVDVGANIGVYSVLAAHKIGTEGRVVSFEPNPRTAEILRANALLTGVASNDAATIEVNEIALGNRSEKTNLMFMENMTGGAYISNEREATRSERGWSNVPVTVERWDDFFDGDFKPDVVKLDVEGHEVDAMAGADGLLCREGPISIFMEAVPDMWRGQGHEPTHFIEGLISRGLGISVIDHKGNSLGAGDPDSIVKRLDDLSRSGHGLGHLLLQR